MLRRLILLPGLIALSAIADVPHPRAIDNRNFDGLYAVGDIFVAGQPRPDGLAWAKQQGVVRVINLRTPDEMKKEGDEAGAAASLGLDYVSIPVGGDDHPFTPAAVEQFAAALDGIDGKVLLHCRSGNRASHLWAAWMVRHRGLSVPDAIDAARQMNFGSFPIEGFLGEKLVIDVRRAESAAGEASRADE